MRVAARSSQKRDRDHQRDQEVEYPPVYALKLSKDAH
jgi:hypothetical protein